MTGRVEPSPSGILLVDKPQGPTSHEVVELARQALATRRVGHTGTLDPFASGLLILCVGSATRLSEYFHIPAKRYEAVLRLGRETTSHDPEGEVVAESEAWRELSRADVEGALRRFTGRIAQRPPALSAKRVDGRRAHALVRSGEDVELPATWVWVHSLDLVVFEPPSLSVMATASTGTYVRSLARDLGRKLGCGAHLTALHRLAIGDLCASDGLAGGGLVSNSREEILACAAWLDPAEALSWLPSRQLSEEELELVRTGRPLRAPEPEGDFGGADAMPAAGDGPVRLLHAGRLVAVAERSEALLQPRKVFVG